MSTDSTLPAASPPATDETPLPCPFCGCSPAVYYGTYMVRVECCDPSCVVNPCTSGHDTGAEAVAAWSRRAAVPAAPAGAGETPDAWALVYVETGQIVGLVAACDRHAYDSATHFAVVPLYRRDPN